MAQKVNANFPLFTKIVLFICIAAIFVGFICFSMASEGDGPLIGSIVAGVGLLIYFNFILACCFYGVACDKGYEQMRYVLVPFFFGIGGYLLIVALPDRGNLKNPAYAQPQASVPQAQAILSDELPDL